ncbi:hypothetical protein TNCV_3200051 [Trichonephila clavipes]|nr:hypothetical protein TNCV_3200051 [Trichonephila clavipes]
MCSIMVWSPASWINVPHARPCHVDSECGRRRANDYIDEVPLHVRLFRGAVVYDKSVLCGRPHASMCHRTLLAVQRSSRCMRAYS